MDDRKMIRLIGQGKTEYINDAARLYYDDIYRFCCFQTGNREEAYDLAQETFLRFIRYVDGRKEGNLKGYLLTIAMNVCRDCWKEKKRRNVETGWEKGIAETVPAQTDAGTEERLMIQEALLMLPDFQREAIVLHFYYDLKYREIAKMTGTGTSTVKSRIRQGCRKLREILGEGAK
ncbi:MAG: RNA polymerase sigma factor [Eubacteriales bacterium]|nr:RNA polymerase sigma factor [Eubacteriales bacterium]